MDFYGKHYQSKNHSRNDVDVDFILLVIRLSITNYAANTLGNIGSCRDSISEGNMVYIKR